MTKQMSAPNPTATAGAARAASGSGRSTSGASQDLSTLEAAVTALGDAEAALPAALGNGTHPALDGLEVVDFLPDAYFITDAAGVVLYANRASSTLLGHARTYGMGKPLTSLVMAADQARFRTRLAALQALTGNWVREWEQRLRPRGSQPETVVTIRAAPRRDRAGTLVGFQWLMRDRTPEYLLKAEATEREQALRDQIAQLTATLRLHERLNSG
jgi:PAS domain S-box-containing protein